MANRSSFFSCFTALLVLLIGSSPICADQGKDLFEKQCASCHTIGSGDSGGPDLKGVGGRRSVAWLERVIVEPDKLTADKDPVQLELVKKYGFEMPNLGISHDDAKKIIAHLKGDTPPATAKPAAKSMSQTPSIPEAGSVAVAPTAEQPVDKKLDIVVTPELIGTGKALFTGGKQLSKGGAPCVACHTFRYSDVQSGNLAADLTGLYERMGEQGVSGVLKSLKFPIMKKIYADRPLSDEEITAIIAFLKDAALKKDINRTVSFPLTGIGLFVLLLLGLALYKRRIR